MKSFEAHFDSNNNPILPLGRVDYAKLDSQSEAVLLLYELDDEALLLQTTAATNTAC